MKHSAKTNKDIPYYQIFNAFRSNGYPIGIPEYTALLDLIAGVGNYTPTENIISRNELLELCKLLWLKPDQVPFLFEALFNECYAKLFNETLIPHTQEQVITNDEDLNKKKITNVSKTPDLPIIDLTEFEDQSTPLPVSDGEKREYFRIVIGSQTADKTSFRQPRAGDTDRKFLFSDRNFPVSRRNIYQLFSKVPEKKLTQASHNVDIQATLNSIAQNGFLKEIVFRRENEVVNQLLILHDRQGSMVAFEKLSTLLSAAITELFNDVARKRKQVLDYYFQNVVNEFIYLNTSSTKFQKVNDFINDFKGKKVSLIIISDAGAARGGNSDLRVKNTIRMLMKFQNITTKIVWLNPLPAARWENTSAFRIAKFVPMFEIDYNGLSNAVELLRGKQYKAVR